MLQRTGRDPTDAKQRKKAVRALEKVFEVFALDPLQPEHWDRLRAETDGYFANRRAGEFLIRGGRYHCDHDHSGGRGRPKGSAKWNPLMLLVLACNLHIVILDEKRLDGLWWWYSRNWPMTRKKAASLILKRFPNQYKDIDVRAISRRLPAAVRLWKQEQEYLGLVREQEHLALVRAREALQVEADEDALEPNETETPPAN
jgi:hypothetical protein